VFGVSSDEYLNYALSNRLEWEEKGKSVVAEVVESLEAMNADLWDSRRIVRTSELTLA
jgi:hypothetical protein